MTADCVLIYLWVTMEEEELSGLDKKKEWIRVEVEIMRLAAIVGVATGGGIGSLIISRPTTGVEFFFLALGLITFFSSVIIGVKRFLKLKRKLN